MADGAVPADCPLVSPADLQPELDRERITGTILLQTWNNLGQTWDHIRDASGAMIPETLWAVPFHEAAG